MEIEAILFDALSTANDIQISLIRIVSRNLNKAAHELFKFAARNSYSNVFDSPHPWFKSLI